MSEINYEILKAKIEALLFVSGEGLTISDVSQGLNENSTDVETAIHTLIDDYLERNGGIIIQDTGGKYRFTTSPDVFDAIQEYLQTKKKNTLSKAMMETLAIITYKQPITMTEVEEIRGVNSRSIITGLINRKLIKVAGQKEAPGKPSFYATTNDFLEYFGLNSLQELPPPRDVKELNFDEL
jgi:segregation and condensation protein B